jgi:hypothetical protein
MEQINVALRDDLTAPPHGKYTNYLSSIRLSDAG